MRTRHDSRRQRLAFLFVVVAAHDRQRDDARRLGLGLVERDAEVERRVGLLEKERRYLVWSTFEMQYESDTLTCE